MDHLSASLVAKSLNFHGQPLFSVWQGERGDNDLMRIGLINPDFSLYQARQKNLAFQDRAKRLKLHQFISKKANALFDANLQEEVPPNSNFQNDGSYAKMPPYEVFIDLDKNDRQRHFFDVSWNFNIFQFKFFLISDLSSMFKPEILSTERCCPRQRLE